MNPNKILRGFAKGKGKNKVKLSEYNKVKLTEYKGAVCKYISIITTKVLDRTNLFPTDISRIISEYSYMMYSFKGINFTAYM